MRRLLVRCFVCGVERVYPTTSEMRTLEGLPSEDLCPHCGPEGVVPNAIYSITMQEGETLDDARTRLRECYDEDQEQMTSQVAA